jgi:aerobic carbon-monoxide dehydrogenase medium subunit
MKSAPFDYVVPDTVEAAVEHLSGAAGDGVILAGGQTLVPLLALRMATPSLVIDINRIQGLPGITRADGGTRIGATTRQAEILTSALVAQHTPALGKAVAFVGHHQTRNRGTLGGSISLAEPAAEIPATSLALGAVIEAVSAQGTRRIPAGEFFLGPYTTALEPDEMVVAVHYPDWPAGTVTLVEEISRRPGDFALVGLVCALAVEGGKFTRAGIGWFGMGPTPMRSVRAEAALVGQSVAGVDLAGIAQLAISDTDPLDDLHATSAYRRTVGARVFQRVVAQALNMRSAA